MPLPPDAAIINDNLRTLYAARIPALIIKGWTAYRGSRPICALREEGAAGRYLKTQRKERHENPNRPA
jgi:hypothetical protein